MIEPAVKGTRNVINAAADVGVQRVVFTSSIGCVYMNPRYNPGSLIDETCWSDLEYCKNTKVPINKVSTFKPIYSRYLELQSMLQLMLT